MKFEIKNRWLPVIASITIQLCLGTAYIWSVFQSGIATALFFGDNAKASLTFSLLLAILGIGGVVSGILKKYISVRGIVMLGGAILGVGFILASFVTAKFGWLLWVTYGLMGGIGMGLTYSTTIAVSQKWFPDKRGLITGIIVASLGLGGVIFTPLVEAFIKAFSNGTPGSGELKSFMVLGFIFLIVCTIGSLFIVEPPKDYIPKGWIPKLKSTISAVSLSPKQILTTPQYYIITLSFALACMGGLMMIGFAKPIAIAKGMGEVAVAGVIVISLFNSLGRLFWGWVSDKWGRKTTILILLCGTAILSLFVNIANGYFIFVLIAFIGFIYGGFLSNYAALTADYFGQTHMAVNYGFVLIGFGAGAVISSFVAGHFKNLAANEIKLMFPAFVISAVAAMVALVLISFLKPIKTK